MKGVKKKTTQSDEERIERWGNNKEQEAVGDLDAPAITTWGGMWPRQMTKPCY